MKLKYLGVVILELLIIVVLMKKLLYPCEMVCMARTNLQADSLYETNDIVDILPNGTIAKLKIDNPKAFMLRTDIFYVVYVPDLSVDEAKTKYLTPRLDTNEKIVANREYKIDTEGITINKGEATTDKTTLASQLVKKAVAVVDEP
jgi:hypothetical protein